MLTSRVAGGGGPATRAGRCRAGTGMRRTSICGLGQVALAPVPASSGCSVVTLQRGPAPGCMGGTSSPPSDGGCGAAPGSVPDLRTGRNGAAGGGPRRSRRPRHCAALATGLRPVHGRRLRGAGRRHLRRVRGAARLPTWRPGSVTARVPRRGSRSAPGWSPCPPAASCPGGADAVVMVGHTQEAMPGTSRWPGRSRRATGWSAPTRTSPPAPNCPTAGRPLRAQDLGLLAAAGVT